MKCAGCGTDVKKKDRPDGKCPSCRRAFVFDPQNGDPLTDVGFQHALERVSANGKVRWHSEHLYAELRRRTRKDHRGLATFGLVMAGIFGAAAIGFALLGAVLGARGLGGAVAFQLVAAGIFLVVAMIGRASSRPGIDGATAHVLVGRWRSAKQPLAGLIEPAKAPPRLTPELEEELEHYSFDRAVVTDSRMIVDTLVANNFHFENNCAVLAVDGYPKHTFGILRKMVRQNPRIQVFVLHDATPEGCSLAHKLRTDPEWFAGIGTVVDVGLRPAHARYFPGMEESPEPGMMGEGISPKEAAWLTRHSLRLAIVRPEQLVKRLFRGITVVEAGGGGDGVIYMGMDSDTSDGGGDSFG